MTLLRRLSVLVLATALAVTLGVVPSAPPAHAASATELTLVISHTELRRGEGVWLRGMLTSGGNPVPKQQIVVERNSGGSKWTVVGSATTRDNGTWTLPTVPVGDLVYRAVYRGSSSYEAKRSGTVTYQFNIGRRTLEQRMAHLGERRTGPAQSEVQSATVGEAQVRWQAFHGGVLVEVIKGTNIRTWYITGGLRDAYMAEGGPTGRLGLPINDSHCGKVDFGCVQRFTQGAMYWSPVAQRVGIETGGTSERMNQIIATARSQVGYKAPSNNISRYNHWIGSTYAWCSIFQSWASMASGNGRTFPVKGKFSYFHAEARERGPIGKTPRVGALAFYDTHLYDGRTAATHTGLVTAVNGSYIKVIEGNTTPPGGGSGRGVYEKTRLATQALYYWYPNY